LQILPFYNKTANYAKCVTVIIEKKLSDLLEHLYAIFIYVQTFDSGIRIDITNNSFLFIKKYIKLY